MGVDFLRLHCVRGTVSSVCRAVEALVAEHGWQKLDRGAKRSASNFYGEVRVGGEAGWIVIDAAERHFEPWAARIASSLATTGITLTSYSDEGAFELARYEGARRLRQLSHRSEAKPRPVRMSLAAMSDLVPASRRAALRRGVLVPPHDSDHTVLEIARLVGLPKPLATNELVDDGRLLRFCHAPPPRLDHSPVDRPRTRPGMRRVSFEETIHVRGVSREAIARAMGETLAIHDFVPVAATADPMTWAAGIVRVFVHEQDGVWSVGESAIDDGGTVPVFKWAEVLSRRLGSPVLSVWREGDAAEMTLWVGGRDEARVDLGSREGPDTLDATPFAAFASPNARAQLRAVRVHESLERTLLVLGGALGLAVPTLTGQLEGAELRFRRAGRVNPRPYEDEQIALEMPARFRERAKRVPALAELAALTPEESLAMSLKPARRV